MLFIHSILVAFVCFFWQKIASFYFICFGKRVYKANKKDKKYLENTLKTWKNHGILLVSHSGNPGLATNLETGSRIWFRGAKHTPIDEPVPNCERKLPRAKRRSWIKKIGEGAGVEEITSAGPVVAKRLGDCIWSICIVSTSNASIARKSVTSEQILQTRARCFCVHWYQMRRWRLLL